MVVALLRWVVQDQGLSRVERLQLVRREVTAELGKAANGPDLLWWVGGLAAAALVLLPLVYWIRRTIHLYRWMEALRQLGLDDDEVQLFAQIARRAPLALLRQPKLAPHLFDKVAHKLLKRIASDSKRDVTMLRILALRHRLPFRDAPALGTVEAGMRVHARASTPADAPSVRADVVTSEGNVLKLSLIEEETGPPLIPGMQVVVRALLLGHTCETTANVRHRLDGTRPRLQVDCLAPFRKARLALLDRIVSVPAKLNLVERLPSRTYENTAPIAEALVTRETTVGVNVTVRHARLTFGEGVQLVAGPLSGEYVAFDEVATSRDQSRYFLMRVSSARRDAAIAAGAGKARPASGRARGRGSALTP